MSWKIPSFENFTYSRSSTFAKLIEYENKPMLSIPEKHIVYRQIKSSLNSLLKYPNNNMKFPGNLPVSLLRENIPMLFHHSLTYGVIEKTDGCRYLMYITMYKSQVVIALFDRAWQQYWLLDVIVYEKLALGTILDVEYVEIESKEEKKQKQYVFYIFDVLAYKGISIIGDKNYHYITRLEIARLIVDHLIKQIPNENGIVFKVKNPQPISELQQFIQYQIPKIQIQDNVPIDGLIFVPLENPYKSGQDFETYKLKNGTDNTVDFALYFGNTSEDISKYDLKQQIQFTSKKIPVELWVETGGTSLNQQQQQQQQTKVSIDFKSTKEQQQGAKQEQKQFYTLTYLDLDKIKEFGYEKKLDLHQKIVQCRWINNLWVIEKIREDKKHANHIYTVKKTEQNIEENIKVEELFCQCNNCKLLLKE